MKRKRQATEARRAEKRTNERARVWRRRAAHGGTYALLVCSLAVLTALALDRPVGRIEISGKFQRVSPLQIEQAVAPHVQDGFVSLNLQQIKRAVEAIPWVDHARVERRWPNSVTVQIAEQVPVARWGERGLLNARGELFLKNAPFASPELPQLVGADGVEGKVAQLYLKTSPRLAGVGLRLSRVSLDERGAWELTVTSAQSGAGVVVRLGRAEEVELNARLERFIRAASPVIAARAAEALYVDMRYSSGFAIGWDNGAALVKASDASPRGGVTKPTKGGKTDA